MTKAQLQTLRAVATLGGYDQDNAVSTRDVRTELYLSRSAAWRRLKRLSTGDVPYLIEVPTVFPQTDQKVTYWYLSAQGRAALEDA